MEVQHLTVIESSIFPQDGNHPCKETLIKLEKHDFCMQKHHSATFGKNKTGYREWRNISSAWWYWIILEAISRKRSPVFFARHLHQHLLTSSKYYTHLLQKRNVTVNSAWKLKGEISEVVLREGDHANWNWKRYWCWTDTNQTDHNCVKKSRGWGFGHLVLARWAVKMQSYNQLHSLPHAFLG